MRPVTAWFLILLLAMANGFLREAVLIPAWGRPPALVASGVLLSAVILLVALVLVRWMRLASAAQAARVGLLWVALTLVFEFGFGGLVQGKPMAELLEAYTFRDGNIWPLVLLVTLLAPPLAYRLRH